ncbi:MAG: cysteine desulfurase [Bacteroidetes bacterium]|nr:cysteine desulfurase [Bacteroidota bacterium]
MNFNVEQIRKDFPLLGTRVYSRPVIYFDNAATTQKPECVIELINEYHRSKNSNIHRGVHYLSEKMTESYENARKTVRQFINAKYDHEVLFTSGTTGGINLIASSFGERFIGRGDEVLISAMEHHSNLVPWQLLCGKKGAVLKVIPVNPAGELEIHELDNLLTDRTRIVAVVHVSNSLGTINPVRHIIEKAHEKNIPVLVDGAQSVQHTRIDVQEMNCDFYAFSGHKVYGPTGIGVLYGKEKWMDAIPPYQGGGDMIESVSFEKTTYAKLPFKFEAGTTNFIGAAGLAAALKYIDTLGIETIARYEKELLDYATEKLKAIDPLTIYGNAAEKTGVISFLIGGIHFFDTGMILDKMDIAVRTGHHCTQPLMKLLGIEGTVRASLSFYNTKEEIDRLIEGINKVIKMFN